MKIAMIGTGYVGLVSGACFSEFGTEVVCVDHDADKIAALRRGEAPIYEPGLADLMARNADAGRLTFTGDIASAVAGADAAFLAVGTPARPGDGHADVSAVYDAARAVAAHAPDGLVIVTKSTVPVGTARELEGLVHREAPDRELHVAANPEFLREGAAIDNFMHPDRVIVGANSERSRSVLEQLYRPLSRLETPTVFTTLETAELTKYAANAFLATKITFINEMADLCEAVGADVHALAHGMGLDRRIGRSFLNPGPGYGGSCFPKDTSALIQTARGAAAPTRIVEAAAAVNDARKESMAHRIAAHCGGVAGRTIAVLGVTFKPNTDDMRAAPSRVIIPLLQSWGATIRAHDPAGMAAAREVIPGVTWCRDAYEALEGAACAAVLTEWNEYRNLDPARMKAALAEPRIADLRNIYDPASMAARGFAYRGIGRITPGAG